MKISLNWLKDYVDLEMEPEALSSMLTMAGLEVEGIEKVGQSLKGVVAGRILEVLPHPNADKLRICRVGTGTEEFRVVCGAPNLNVGDTVPLATLGAILPNGIEVRSAAIRGETSSGMLLAEDEMGLSDDHSGIMILPQGIKEGTSVSEALSLRDCVMDIGITPNRPDCTSLIGIAREIAAVTGKKLRMPKIYYPEAAPSIEELTSVSIHDPIGCRRYGAGVIKGVRPGPSPFWMRYRLLLSGIRSINSVVDVTNYVMLETGQPLHAFDYDLLVENRIQVRRASEGETFTTLDGKSHRMTEDHLMICDGGRSVALAGIMGGINSEISSETINVLLESAYFDPVTIRRGAKSLGVSTEASYRFERGIDLENVINALKRAMALIRELAGGSIASGVIDNYPSPYAPVNLKFRVEKTNRYLGTSMKVKEMAEILRGLEMKVEVKGEDELAVVPPSFRVDITREVDLTEEIARLYGYEKIPVTTPAVRSVNAEKEAFADLKEKTCSIMSGMGYSEVVTYSFVSPQYPDILGADKSSSLRAFVKVLNPLTVDQSVMRTSLVPGLMDVVRSNVFHDEKDLRLFEWGKVFTLAEQGPLPRERVCLAGVLAGLFQKKTWYGEERPSDFFDIKGTVEGLLRGLGADNASFQRDAGDRAYDPEISVRVFIEGTAVGRAGRVSTDLARAYELDSIPLYLFEIEVEDLIKGLKKGVKFMPLAKFPAVYRDISIIVDKAVDSGTITCIIKQEGGELVESVRVFDLYEGRQMGQKEKAVAYRICYRSRERTLEGAEVNLLYEKTIGRIIRETGGRLREA